MSWLRTAVNKAVEAGKTSNISRNLKNYADTVVQQAGQAVAEGAKIFQDRIGSRSFKSLRQTVKRLEEAAISCRGPERAMLLRRWLVALKEIEKPEVPSECSEKSVEQILASDEAKENPQRPPVVLYYDADIGGVPMNFREVFLQSQALEFITISMIIEAPNVEEISLLQQMFQLCLTGGKEVHNPVVSSIQDLASAFSSYQDEVLAKREELLQFVQSAITGLKINADLLRTDSEASDLKKKFRKLSTLEGHDNASDSATKVTIEALKEALAVIRNCSTLEKVLMKKKSLNNGDSPELHSMKVDKLKVLSESLASSCAKAEKRILDHRFQKEEALTVRVTRATEAEGKEKEMVAEISALERQRDELEAELKKVNISLATATARLRDVREERDQFNEANNEVVSLLKMKEDELSKSISACRVEAEVLQTWINFLEDTWLIQSKYSETKNKQVNEELEQHENYFLNLAVTLLSDYKKELKPAISRISTFVENLNKLNKNPNGDFEELNPRKHLEVEYLDYEAKIITTFSVVDSMKEHLYKTETLSRKDDPMIKELFNDLGKLRVEFEAIERPTLELETPRADIPIEDIRTTAESTQPKHEATEDSPEAQPLLDHEAELAQLESEFGNGSQGYSANEIGDWEFDELERELRSDDTTPL
ncbi:uncharacterized protein LOC120156121 isoform X2 [Hibiscus syriacus]|uniref:uncharacterized protein LOC120156121 isoform X2 n=1 Tax=Hibiscus syriacus TaxID=106335 RepID=UPI001924A5AB|nr:uncharacterized protein LOC120156121 isoform X2 [Hibiscus syriacus]